MKQEDKTKLKEIREERNKDKQDKVQKRKVEVIEYEDGTYSLIGFAWDLPLQKKEVLDAFENWFDGSLQEGIKINL